MQALRQTGILGRPEVAIHGTCDPNFNEVREEFERNFSERGDVGASVCIVVEGKPVVNLWGGMADPETGKPWDEDTLTVIMSVTKGATATCAHMLIDRGLLDLDAPVAEYWPEFGKHGKEAITVRMLLNHQAGLPAIRKPVPYGKFLDWEWVIAALEDERPFWEPGTRAGYHALTFGFLVGELIRRVSGKSLGAFFRDEIAGPLGLDFWIGLPESEHHRVAPLRMNPEDPMIELLESDPDPQSNYRLAFANNGGYLGADGWNDPAAYAAEFGAAGALANARAVAGLYAPLSLDGSIGGVRLVEPATLRLMSETTSAVGLDATVGIPMGRYSLGFDKDASDAGLGERAFGHVGWGGSNGFADPHARLAFGYITNQMHTTDRWEALAKAAYRALSYREDKYGFFTR